MSCCVVPKANDGFTGVTAIETRAGGVMVKVADPVIAPEVALMVVGPVAMPVASPAVLIVATPVAVEAQVTEFVRFCVEPSVKVPVAVNCWVVPAGIDPPWGVTAIETSAGGVTVSVLDPEIPPAVALTVVTPWWTVFARPALIVATVAAADVHFAVFVRSFVVPFE